MKRLLLFPFLCSLALAAPTLQSTVSFTGHSGGIRWGTLTPDGQTAYTQGGNSVIEWDAATGQPRCTTRPLEGKDFAPVREDFWRVDAPAAVRLLVTENLTRQPGATRLSLIDLRTGKVDATFEVGNAPFTVVWGSGQKAVAFADADAGKVWYWREGMTEARSVPGGQRWAFDHPAFSPDNGLLYTLGQDLKAYDTSSGELRWTLPAGEVPGRKGQPLNTWQREFGEVLLESSPYRPRLLVMTPDGLGLLNPETRQWLGYLDARFDRVHGVDWSADGQRLFVMIDGFVHVVNADTGQTLGIVDGEQVISAPDADTLWTKGPAHFLRFRVSSGLDTAAIKGKAAQNSLVAVDTQGRPARWLEQKDDVYSVSTPQGSVPLVEHFTRIARFSPDGTRMASLGDNQLWVLDTKTHQKQLSTSVSNAFDFTFSPDGRSLAVGGLNTRLLDAQTGKLLKVLEPAPDQLNSGGRKWQPGPRGLNRSLAFSPDGRWLAVGYEANAIGLWDMQSGKLVRTLTGGRGWVLSLAYSPDGKTLVSGWGDGTLHFHDVEKGTDATAQQVNSNFVRMVAFAPDGQQVAAASGDGSVSLWTPAGKPLRRLTDHTGAATAVTYLGAHTLVSGDSAGGLRVWNAANGQLLDTFGSASALVQSLVLSPDGQSLLSSDRDNVLRVYEVKK